MTVIVHTKHRCVQKFGKRLDLEAASILFRLGDRLELLVDKTETIQGNAFKFKEAGPDPPEFLHADQSNNTTLIDPRFPLSNFHCNYVYVHS